MTKVPCTGNNARAFIDSLTLPVQRLNLAGGISKGFFIRGEKMNAIEKRFYDAFKKYIKDGARSSVYSDSWEMKIAEYSIDNTILSEEIDYIGVNIDISFPSLKKEIQEISLTIYLTSQQKIGSYTIDFELYAEGLVCDIVRLAIEIDGHDFHEKTKEQAGRDKRRDREITKYDYIIIRFTGSEVYTNAIKCVQESLDILITLIYERYAKYEPWYVDEMKHFNQASSGGNK